MFFTNDIIGFFQTAYFCTEFLIYLESISAEKQAKMLCTIHTRSTWSQKIEWTLPKLYTMMVTKQKWHNGISH